MTGVPPSGSGLRPDGLSQSPLSQAKPLVPNAVAELRKGAEALRNWMQSVVDQQKEAVAWGGHYGHEHAAKDALDIGVRVQATVTASLDIIANALEALASAGEAGTATDSEAGVVHEHATGKAGDAQEKPGSRKAGAR